MQAHQKLIFLISCSELTLPDIPTHVELHALQTAQCICEEHGGGYRPGTELQLRVPTREHHERVLPPAQLQPHADWRPAGHEGLWHWDASG